MSNFNSFRTLRGLLKYKLLGKRTPINVSISVTNMCNLRCSYCDIPYRKQREMTTEEIKKILDDLKELGCVRVGLWGGEPLVRQDIGELVRYSKDKGFYTTLISNGYLVPQKINEIKDLDLLFLSLDGPKEIHDKNRKEGSFDAVIKAIKMARENHIPLATITVLTEENMNQINYVLQKAEELDFLCTFQLIYRGSEFTEKEKETEIDYRPVISKIIRMKKEGKPVASSYSYLRHLLGWPDYRKTAIFPKKMNILKCYGNQLFCNVDTDGKIYPCDWMRNRLEGKDCVQLGFKKAWKEAPIPECGGCVKSCYTEYNKIFSFRLEAMRNAIKFVKS